MGTRHGLERIAQVYALVERMRSAELALAHGALLEAERALQEECEVRSRQAGAGRAALMIGDRAERALADAQQCAASMRTLRLVQLRTEREAEREQASDVHRTSRVEQQQVECSLKRARQLAQQEEERRAQGAADDRYLARREWTRLRETNDGHEH